MSEGKFDPLALFTKEADERRDAEGEGTYKFGVDHIQVQRDAKRRAKSEDGTLRARAHPTKRPREVRGKVIRGYMETGFMGD